MTTDLTMLAVLAGLLLALQLLTVGLVAGLLWERLTARPLPRPSDGGGGGPAGPPTHPTPPPPGTYRLSDRELAALEQELTRASQARATAGPAGVAPPAGWADWPAWSGPPGR